MDYYLSINPGVAYIKGKRVELSYSFHYVLSKLDPFSNLSTLPSVTKAYLTSKGDLFIGQTLPTDALYLGTIYLDAVKAAYLVSSTTQRAVTNADLKLLEKYNVKTRNDLATLLLTKQAADQGTARTSDLTGVFTDSFTNLAQSDYNNTLYTSLLEHQQLKAGITSQTIDFSNVEFETNQEAALTTKNNSPYYLTSNFADKPLFTQVRATDWLTLANYSTVRASILLTPASGLADTSKREFNLISNEYSSLNLELTLASKDITLQCFGLGANTDNLNVTFGSIRITEFTLLENTLTGSGFATVKSKADGTASLSFNIPANLTANNYVVTLGNSTVAASAVFSYVDKLRVGIPTLSYQNSHSSVGQTFKVDYPVVLTALKLAFRKVPSLDSTLPGNTTFLVASLVKTFNNLPTGEVIGQGLLNLSDVQVSENSSKWTTIEFDRPVALECAGQYAFVLSPLIEGGEVYLAEVGKANLTDGSLSSLQPFLGGELVLKEGGVWQNVPAKDLKFELIQGIPAAISVVTFLVTSPYEFNKLLLNLPYQTLANTSVDVEYQIASSQWRTLSNQTFPKTKQALVRLTLHNTESLAPLIELNNAAIVLQNNLESSRWLSKTVAIDFAYTNVELTFNYFAPEGTLITPFCSSNNGETWEPLILMGEIRAREYLVDGNIPLYKGTFRALALTPTVTVSDLNGVTTSYLRKKLTLRVDFDLKDTNLTAYIEQLSCLVY